MRRRSASVMLALLLAGALLTGCNRGDDIDASAGGPTTTTTAAVPSSPSTTDGAATPPVSTPPGTQRAHLTAVRLDTKEGGASRVVFELDPVLPGYRVELVERPVTMDGSGDEVPVAGEAVVEVAMENAAQARFEGEKVVPTYTGPRRLAAAAGGAVVEVVEAGDFEGLVRWVIGLRQKDAEISVSTLSGPSRIVVDVKPA